MKKMLEFSTVFWIGGAVYNMIEVLWRGYTHWSMTLTGGVCFAAVYFLHVYALRLSFFARCLIGTAAITAAEFAAGCVVNLWLRWDVWDYSRVPFNLYGQVCLLYSFLWFGLCAAAAPLCRVLARRIQSEGRAGKEIIQR